MTGYQSKKTAALDEDGMYLVHHTAQQDATMQSLKDLKRSVCDGVGKAAFAQPEQEPQRPWVDLTPQDYAEIFRTARNVDHAARLATAKLKEKNNG